MKKLLFFAYFATFSLVGVVYAADLRTSKLPESPPSPSPLVTPSNWDGFYVGIHTGTSFGKSVWRDADPTKYSFESSQNGHAGTFLGGTLGYNRQIGPYVFGLEADAAFGKLNGNTYCFSPVEWSNPNGGYTVLTARNCYAKTNVLGSVAGRVGTTFGSALLYAKAGWAYAHDQYHDAYTYYLLDANGNPTYMDPDGYATNPKKVHRFGWTLGAGVEYALTHELSAKFEYDYYHLGNSKAVTLSEDGKEVWKYNISRSQQLLKFGLQYRWAEPNATAVSNASPDISGEFGARLGWATGTSRKDLDDANVTSHLNSRLTYSNLASIPVEAFVRLENKENIFLKGTIGGANLYGGHLYDEDFPPVVTPYSKTKSSQKDGSLLYGWADLGYYLLNQPEGKLGAFVGGQLYSQRENAFGCTQVAQGYNCNTSDSLLGITQAERWMGMRLGLYGSLSPINRLTLSFDAAFLPYLQFKGKDTHWQRYDLSPIQETGRGYGLQVEGIASYALTDRVQVGVGARYMALKTTSAHADFFGPPYSPEKWRTNRTTLFLQASYRFGT